jgi:mycothiol synthase
LTESSSGRPYDPGSTVTGEPEPVSELTPAQVSAILALVAAATSADEVAPLSEHGMLRVQHNVPGQGQDVLIGSGAEVVGYGYVEPPTAERDEQDEQEATGEFVVHPAHRRRGHGAALAEALAATADGRPLRVWAHGDLPAAAALARSAGFERFRALWQMRRSLRDLPPMSAFPPGITLRAFRVGQDEDEWLRVNSRAFAKHPEQGSWTRRDLELREAEPWFDPNGFFIAERNGVMVGFHWTKVHPSADGPIGEVYVVGVDPDEHGGGIGRALTLAGLDYLRARGLDQVLLYADEENVAAIKMYSKLGFTRWHTDAMYRRPATVSYR